jgi:sugar lactone lactonase YvrE
LLDTFWRCRPFRLPWKQRQPFGTVTRAYQTLACGGAPEDGAAFDTRRRFQRPRDPELPFELERESGSVSFIKGKKTGLGTPDNIALDSSDNIYTSINGKTIGVFAANAHGDARRIRQIGGSNTQLSFPIGVAVDSNGYLYVADCGDGNVKVFAPGAHGNVAPVHVIGLTSG